MANAQTTQTETPKPPANRFMGDERTPGLFAGITFQAAKANSKIYGADEPGADLVRKLANVTIECLVNGRPSGAYLVGAVHAKQAHNGGDVRAVFDFLYAQGSGRALQANDFGAEAELDAYKIYVASQCVKWMTANGATAAANVPADAPVVVGLSLKK